MKSPTVTYQGDTRIPVGPRLPCSTARQYSVTGVLEYPRIAHRPIQNDNYRGYRFSLAFDTNLALGKARELALRARYSAHVNSTGLRSCLVPSGPRPQPKSVRFAVEQYDAEDEEQQRRGYMMRNWWPGHCEHSQGKSFFLALRPCVHH